MLLVVCILYILGSSFSLCLCLCAFQSCIGRQFEESLSWSPTRVFTGADFPTCPIIEMFDVAESQIAVNTVSLPCDAKPQFNLNWRTAAQPSFVVKLQSLAIHSCDCYRILNACQTTKRVHRLLGN